jgi:hypothetical protein
VSVPHNLSFHVEIQHDFIVNYAVLLAKILKTLLRETACVLELLHGRNVPLMTLLQGYHQSKMIATLQCKVLYSRPKGKMNKYFF